MQNYMILKIKAHPLVKTLLGLKGNSRACVLTEPLFAIPNHMIAPFATLYMYNLGLDDVKIGSIISIGLFCQLITSFIGGTVTDKFGRRKTTLIADLLSISLPCLVWMSAQNFWWFLTAAVLFSINWIAASSWSCLLVEDSDRNQLGGIYTWIHIGGMLSVLFVPIGGLMVDKLTIVPAVRIMYFIFCVMLTTKAVVLYKFSTETKRGVIRMEESKGLKFFDMISESLGLLPMIFKSRRMLTTLVIIIFLNITVTVSTNFYSLLLTQSLNMPVAILAYFPIIKTVCTLIFMFAFQSAMDRLHAKIPMLFGLAAFISCQLMLVLAQFGGMPVIIAYVVIEAFAMAIVTPRRDTLLAANIMPEERARIIGIMNAIMLGSGIPFGYLAGLLSSVNRILPFVMNIIIYIFLFILIIVSKTLFVSKKEGE